MNIKSDPMLPYTCYGLDDFRCEYEALARVDENGIWYKREEVDALIDRLRSELQRAADSFRNLGCAVDADDCEEAINESLSGGNPGEPKACTGAEERGISGATGAGQHPDDNSESTGDSADRRSPDGTDRTPSPDESNRQPHEPLPAPCSECERLRAGLSLIATDEHRLMNITARMTAESILSGKPIGAPLTKEISHE